MSNFLTGLCFGANFPLQKSHKQCTNRFCSSCAFFFCRKALYHHDSSFDSGFCTQIRTIPHLSPHLGALCSTFRPRARKHTPSRRSLSTLISCKVGADSFKESPAATTTVRRRLFRLLVGISVMKIKLCFTHARGRVGQAEWGGFLSPSAVRQMRPLRGSTPSSAEAM